MEQNEENNSSMKVEVESPEKTQTEIKLIAIHHWMKKMGQDGN